MQKGNVLKLLSGQLVKVTKVNNDILTVKKAGINRTEKYIEGFGKYQGIGKEFNISIDEVKEVIQ